MKSNKTTFISPFHHGVVRPHAGGQQVVPVVQQLVLFAAVSYPYMGHAGHAAGQTQQVLPGATVLVCDEQALVSRLALNVEEKTRSTELMGAQLGFLSARCEVKTQQR